MNCPSRQMRVDHRLAPQQQHGGEPELGEEGEDRVVSGFQPRRDHRLVEDAPHAAPEALQLAGLAREGLDDPHPGDVLLGVRGELGDALLHLLDRGARAVAVAVGDQHHERHRRQRDQAELGVDRDHRDPGEHDREDDLQDEDEPVAEEEAHRLQVDGRARHQLAGLLVVEEAELQSLEMAVEPLAQVVLDTEGDPPGDHPPPVRKPPADQHDGEDRQREHQQRVAIVRAQREFVVAGVARAGADRFHRAARQERERDGHRHREAREDPGGGQRRAGRGAGSRAVGRRSP